MTGNSWHIPKLLIAVLGLIGLIALISGAPALAQNDKFLRVQKFTIAKQPTKARPNEVIVVKRPPQSIGDVTIVDIMDAQTLANPPLTNGTTALFADKLAISGQFKRGRSKSRDDIILLADKLIVRGNGTIDVSGRPLQKRARTKVFNRPKWRNQHLDWCLRFGTQCGKPAADAFCRKKRFDRASKFTMARDIGSKTRPTLTIGDNRFCRAAMCDGFRKISCSKMSYPSNVAREGRSGNITIFVRELVCDGGKLNLVAKGGRDGNTTVGRGGKINFGFDQAPNGRNCVKMSVAGKNAARKFHPSMRSLETFRPDIGPELLGSWVLAKLNWLAVDVNQAAAQQDIGELIRIFREYELFANRKRFPITAKQRDQWRLITKELLDARTREIPRIWSEQITVPRPGIGSDATYGILFSAKDGIGRLSPTDILVSRFNHQGKSVLGFIEFDPDRPERMVLKSISASLEADPWVYKHARSELQKSDRELEGVFANWALSLEPVEIEGLRNLTVEPTSGTRFNITLELDTGTSAVVLERLVRDGIPISFAWVSREDPSLNGTIGPFLLSLGRLNNSDLVVSGGIIRNNGGSEQRARYATNDNGQFFEFDPEVVVQPGQSVPINLMGNWNIPAAAVFHASSSQALLSQFSQVNTDGVLEVVSIVNRLGPDPEFGGALEYVELTIEYDAGSAIQRPGMIRLASRGSLGSEQRLSFIKGPSSPRLTIEGTAFYENGSKQTIPRQTITGTVVHLDKQMLLINKTP